MEIMVIIIMAIMTTINLKDEVKCLELREI